MAVNPRRVSRDRPYALQSVSGPHNSKWLSLMRVLGTSGMTEMNWGPYGARGAGLPHPLRSRTWKLSKTPVFGEICGPHLVVLHFWWWAEDHMGYQGRSVHSKHRMVCISRASPKPPCQVAKEAAVYRHLGSAQGCLLTDSISRPLPERDLSVEVGSQELPSVSFTSQKAPPILTPKRNFKGLGALCQKWGQRPNIRVL